MMQNHLSKSIHHSLNCNGRLLDLTNPKMMGILNITPDSFSDGGKFNNSKSALLQAEKMISEGAEIIDIGAQSTRPNAEKISARDEMERLGNIISTFKKEFPEILISLDTFYSEVVQLGYDEGIDLVNDISGGNYDENMLNQVAKTGLPYILMHSPFSYETMHEKSISEDIILYLNDYFSKKTNELLSLGIKDIILDPGFGFGKTAAQQFQMIDELQYMGFNKFPLLVGVSRKSFIYKTLGKSPNEIGAETQEIHRKVLEKGAKILRVHDVAETRKTMEDFLSENQHHY